MNSHEYSDTSPSCFQNLKRGFTTKKKLAFIVLSCALLLNVVVLFINAQASEESKIAFGAGRGPPRNPLVRSEIYVTTPLGNNQRRLTNNPVFDRTPAWFSTANTISLKCLCIDRVNQVKKFAWSGTRSLVSVQIRRGKMPRLRCKWAIYLRQHMHCYSREMV